MRRLEEYAITGTLPEREYDDIARLAADAFDAPIALLSITEADRHWFKAHIGTDICEVPREVSFCDYTLRQDDVFTVLDATKDERFAHYPLVTRGMNVRFYGGTNIVAPDGHNIGTLCICDDRPRTGIDDRQRRAIESLARLAADKLELRRHQFRMQEERRRANAAEVKARRAHERLRDAIEALPAATLFRDAEDRYVLWNRRYAELYEDISDILRPGVRYEEVLRTSVARGRQVEAIEDPEAWLDWRLRSAENAAPREQSLRDGRWLRIEERRTGDGGTVSVHIDITELKTREAEFRLLFEGNPVPMFVIDRRTLELTAANDAMVQHLGHDRAALIGMNVARLHAECERPGMADILELPPEGSPPRVRRFVTASGKEVLVLPYRQAIEHRGTPSLLVALIDVTERTAAEERVSYLAHHDVLTGLPNRVAFDAHLESAVDQARSGGSTLGLCLVDIDHFKDINDTLGHSAGDAVLRLVARHLRGAVRSSDVVARLGGDEFAIILPDIASAAALDTITRRLLQIGCDVIDGFKLPVPLSASVGVACFPTDAGTAEELVQNADIALYRSKSEGRARLTVFDQALRNRIHRRIGLKNRFRQALLDGEIVPHYQPVVDFTSGRVCALESLARWHHPEHGLLSAAAFADVFEDPELSAGVGLRMLEVVTDDMRRWTTDRVPFGRIAVNVTAADLRLQGFVGEMIRALADKGLCGDQLILEVTENVVMDREDGLVTKALQEVSRHGIRIALDDFGTGHASLTHLKKVDAFTLKIDRSFIRNVVADHEDRAIVNAVIGLGANLGLRTVAEGIETVEQAELLCAAGCTAGQGYLFSRPVPAAEVPCLVASFADRPWSPATDDVAPQPQSQVA